MELSGYLGKRVYITTYEGNIYFGEVADYFYPDENESGKESIVVETTNGKLIGFDEDDIRIIKEF